MTSKSGATAEPRARLHEEQPKVFIVDDMANVGESLARLLESDGLDAEYYSDADSFFNVETYEGPSCLILDVRLPGLGGLDLQEKLRERKQDIPIIFITGHATIPMTVEAMRGGAVDFLSKPLNDEVLLAAVRNALAQDVVAATARAELKLARQRLQSLTPREHEVMQLAIGGLMNKQIACALGTTEITAKVHKRRVMEKMQARSLADLVGMAAALGIRASQRR